jgi:hypothetical protein
MSTKVRRVNGGNLGEHTGEMVRLAGRVDRCSSVVTLISTDGHPVTIRPQGGNVPARFPVGTFVEVTGQLKHDLIIVEEYTVPIPGEIDSDAWNQMVTLVNRHDSIFI